MKLEINSRRKTEKFKLVEIKQHTLKQPMDQRRNHKGNFKILRDKETKNIVYQNLRDAAKQC